MELITGVLAALGGVAGVWAITKFLTPYVGKLVGRLFKARDELDADRDRVIIGLRAEIADLYRRLNATKEAMAEAERKIAALNDLLDATNKRLRDAESFIARFIRQQPEGDTLQRGDAPK